MRREGSTKPRGWICFHCSITVHAEPLDAGIRDTTIEMLRLNPGDNQGMRDWMGTLLLKANRPADALSFVHRWIQPNVLRKGTPPPRGGCVFEAPSQEPLSPQRAKKLGEWAQASLVYSAALAAYKVSKAGLQRHC